MKKGLLFLIIIAAFTACQKEYSTEGGGTTGAGVIIGADCRINKIAFNDSATGTSTGAISATINSSDVVTDITKFDSLTLTIDFNVAPQYFSDTVAIDPDQYFILDNGNGKRVKSFHGLIDPTVAGSPEFDVTYVYDATGYLINKFYTYSLLPGIPYQQVTYTYTGGNLTHMVTDDLFAATIIKDADLDYYTNIAPKNYINLLPDENTYAEFNQFYSFGKKSTNAVKNLKLQYYTNGAVTDSAVSTFQTYILSRDNYVLNVYMLGDAQPCIPAADGKLSFSYKCK